ncbi:MAG: Threonine-tRNA ligase [candidate division TM6 bacterium GW2011_GWF2_37_49]|nr:MAG: Threonine-tRNA ligase [candidate division TM6 bacterium GW2011_GWF2_37_49]
MENNERLHNLRHSAAHLLCQAVLELFPKTIITIGPVTETGFFYDFLPEKNFKEEDLTLIENKMHEIAGCKYKIEGRQVSKDEARKLFKDNKFKLELIDQIPDETVGIYSQGDFYDLCKGGHVDSVDKIKHFKLTSISGAYWRADRNGIALQRITGIAFLTEQDMQDYFKKIEDAEQNDHRKIGKQLDLFTFNDAAVGFPIFLPKGWTIFNKLIEFERKIQQGIYQEIKTPLIMNEDLWKTSGHYSHYRENMYYTKIDENAHCIKPMNCPGGILAYKDKPHSYKELPIRMAEFGFVHRHELSGVLHGLFRVRAFTQDDAHIYCTPEQLESEIWGVVALALKTYKTFGFENVRMGVATKPEKAIGSDELWEKAIAALKSALEKNGIDYFIKEGDGAFYGPKIDMMIQDAMGREWQCGTVQVDFFLPQNFDLKYIAADQSKQTPIMVHRVLYGSLERFMGILIEHYKGHFPFWMAPIQARILTITDQQMEYAKSIYTELLKHDIRIEIDESNDQISAKIRQSQLDKIPWMLVLGKKEVEAGTITLRHVDGKQEFGLKIDNLLNKAKELSWV